jgi:peptidoglycan/LPS O-acetylase OafA/YrhL
VRVTTGGPRDPRMRCPETTLRGARRAHAQERGRRRVFLILWVIALGLAVTMLGALAFGALTTATGISGTAVCVLAGGTLLILVRRWGVEHGRFWWPDL